MGNALVTNLYPKPNATNAGENLAVASSAVSFAALHKDTKYVYIDVQDDSVYVTFDASTPTASNGHILLKEQGIIIISAASARAAKFLQVTGAAVVHMSQMLD